MGSPNFSEVAARVAAGSPDVRACLIVSADGLTLGVFPEDREDTVRHAWGRMVASGEPEPERGFLVVGEEIWAFTRRGGYGALAVAGRVVRPGLLLDALDQALRETHEERVAAAPVSATAAAAPAPAPARETRPASEPARRSRTALHPGQERGTERRVTRRPPGPPVRELSPDVVAEFEDAVPERTSDVSPAPEPTETVAGPPPEPVDVPVDTLELTREFGGLLDGPGGR